MASVIDCQLIPLIDTHDRHLDRMTSWHLDQHLIDSRLSTDCRLSVHGVSTEVSMECRSRVLIDTRPWTSLIHMILKPNNEQQVLGVDHLIFEGCVCDLVQVHIFFKTLSCSWKIFFSWHVYAWYIFFFLYWPCINFFFWHWSCAFINFLGASIICLQDILFFKITHKWSIPKFIYSLNLF